MSKMASNFGKFFSNISKGKKKAPASISKPAVKTKDESSDEESYEDPTSAFPTEAPTPQNAIPVMPNYPPPRLNSNTNSVVHNSTKKRDDYADPYDSKANGVVSPQPYDDQNSSNYADPFDAKIDKNKSIKTNSLNNSPNDDNDDDDDDDDEYDSPYETDKYIRNNKSIDKNQDNYSTPWDMPKAQQNTPFTKSSVRNIRKQDEYSDPWDSKNSSSPKSQDASFDDTYSEPYDKNKSSILDQKKIDDELIEDEMEMKFSDKERRWIGISGSTKGSTKSSSSSTKSNSSRDKEPPVPASLPPENSQGDYDAPWDWKVKEVDKSFDEKCSVGSTKEKNISHTKSVNSTSVHSSSVMKRGSLKNSATKMTDIDKNDPCKAYEVDPTIPLLNQGWFHGRIRRGDAENLLDKEPDCSYLIRNSESSKTDYSLSIRNMGATIHLKISYKDGKYILGVNSRPFHNIPEMIHYYSMNNLNIRGAEQVKLQFPKLQEAVYFTVMPGT